MRAHRSRPILDAKKPEPPPKSVSWDIYRAASKARFIGIVDAADADEAVEKATNEFQVIGARRLLAGRTVGCLGWDQDQSLSPDLVPDRGTRPGTA